ncbi:TPA: ATP-dependent helicase, partial [Legionella pneumophila]|nr:ATP-dependent helicase [Legionella pneumophila]
LSKSVTVQVFRIIQEAIEATRIQMTDEEAILLWPKIKSFVQNNNEKKPDINSIDPLERRLAEALIYIQNQRRQQNL